MLHRVACSVDNPATYPEDENAVFCLQARVARLRCTVRIDETIKSEQRYN